MEQDTPFCHKLALDAPELLPDEPYHICEQAVDSHESARSVGGLSPDLPMDDVEDPSKLSDEWVPYVCI